jgi:hypothetical protein
MGFQPGNRQFGQAQGNQGIARRHTAMYAAHEIPQIDTEIAQKGHFRMETIYNLRLIETFEERPILPKYKEGDNFNRRNTRKYFED